MFAPPTAIYTHGLGLTTYPTSNNPPSTVSLFHMLYDSILMKEEHYH